MILNDSDKLNDDNAQGDPQEEILEPVSKYERIMVAALEASRLNEEMQRKGTKLSNKVTTEAIKRVAEGKVKAVIQRKSEPMEPVLPIAPQPTRDTLFANPQPESDQEEAAEDNEKGKQKATD